MAVPLMTEMHSINPFFSLVVALRIMDIFNNLMQTFYFRSFQSWPFSILFSFFAFFWQKIALRVKHVCPLVHPCSLEPPNRFKLVNLERWFPRSEGQF